MPARRTPPIRPLILASASPRRAELLREHGYQFDVIVPPHPEPTDLPPHMTPVQQAEYLSRFKAAAVADVLGAGAPDTLDADTPDPRAVLILGADTIAALRGQIFGKPADRADARRILSSIAGTVHHVITGVTVMDPATRRCVTCHDVTAVHMRPLAEAELEAYLDSNAWCGKAGAYGIQDHGDQFVTRIEGSFLNVVGLPMELLAKMLAEWPASSEPRP